MRSHDEVRTGRLLRGVAFVQGFFYIATGLWPLLHLPSFEAVTGEKIDDWLVITVGVLITVTGIVLLVAASRNAISLEVLLLAVGNALVLTGIDVYFVSVQRIPPVYLLDAVAEMILVALWWAGWRRAASPAPPATE